jgi:cold shock CspA family protein/ribosome-associated translation inhibitor RaiA
MQVPPEIAFRHVEATDDLKELILDGIQKLEAVYPDLISCRIMVDDDTPDQRTGTTYRVRLEIGIPDHTLIVDRSDPEANNHREVRQAILAAFEVGRKRLQKAKDLQKGEVKPRTLPPHGRITALLTDEAGVRYGFLESRDGRRIYFHEEAVVEADFEALGIGDEVRFAAADGDGGLQASTVALLNRLKVGPVQQKEIPLDEPGTTQDPLEEEG